MTVQVLVPEQPFALHPEKMEPVRGTAVKVTEVPTINSALQLSTHWVMPPGVLLTVPLPVPMSVTVREVMLGGGVKVAEMVWSAFITTTHGVLPVHPSDQPANLEPPIPSAIRVTEVPFAKSALQVLPQLI